VEEWFGSCKKERGSERMEGSITEVSMMQKEKKNEGLYSTVEKLVNIRQDKNMEKV
jgi:hypothetical protein